MDKAATTDDELTILEGVLEDFKIVFYTVERHQGEGELCEATINVENSDVAGAREKALSVYAKKVAEYARANSANLGPQNYTLYLLENYQGRIGGDDILGKFSGASLLRNGDHVKAVVEHGKYCYRVNAMLRERDELLWMPVTVYRGTESVKRRTVQVIIGWCVLSLLLALGMAIAVAGRDWLKLFTYVGGGVVMLFTAMYIFGGNLGTNQGNLAESIFRKLGFLDPANLSVFMGRYESFHDPSIPGIDIEFKSVFFYGLVLAAKQAGGHVSLNLLRLPRLPVETQDNQAEVHEAYLKIKEMVSQPKK